MRNNGQRREFGVGIDTQALVPRPGRGNSGIIQNSFKSLSSYLRIVSSGASAVASTVRTAASAASSVAERGNDTNHNQVLWAGFDKFEYVRNVNRQVLLLGYHFGFQVWDVESSENVRNLVSRHDGPVSFMQMLPTPIFSLKTEDKFFDNRPLLVLCGNGSFCGGDNVQEGSAIPCNDSVQPSDESGNGASTVVRFYSLNSQSYIHLLRFRSVVHLVRCSSRIVAVLQSAQVHCFNAANLEREYTILTNPVVIRCYGSGNVGFGPLAVGSRWMAYSGSQVDTSNSGCVSPQQLTPSASCPCAASNGSIVAHYAKESSKQIAAGIATLGDIGYKKISRYYSELLPEDNNSQSRTVRVRVQDAANGLSCDVDSVGMVIVLDVVRKTVIVQFRGHESHISSLCFDPSGTLLVTASVQGHNINVFRIMPGGSSGPAYIHLYRLQRGFTNAVIQDISFSNDSQWIMISSARGTGHLFAVSPSGGLVNFQSTGACSAKSGESSLISTAVYGPTKSGLRVLNQQSFCASGPPLTVSAVTRIRNGNNGWKNSISGGGGGAAAAGRLSSFSGAISSAFYNSKSNNIYTKFSSLTKHHLLIFSPSGCLIQYALRISPSSNGMMALAGINTNCESGPCGDSTLVAEAIQKWNICKKQNHNEREDKINMFGENTDPDSCKVFSERVKQENTSVFTVTKTSTKQNSTAEERYRMYISEMELQTHQIPIPLWPRSEICFQSILANVSYMAEVSGGGEIEIERITCHMFEARAKNLLPVFNYRHAPKFQHGRVSATNNIKMQLQCSDNGKLACTSNDSFVPVPSDILSQESSNCPDTAHLCEFNKKTRGSVNTNDTPMPNTRLETVNSKDISLRSVDNIDCLKTKNRFSEYKELD